MAHQVQFVGGPLDGYIHAAHHPLDRLPSLATLAVSPDFVRVITGRKRRIVAPPTSTAVYCLDCYGDSARYYHLASIAVQEPRLPREEAFRQPADR